MKGSAFLSAPTMQWGHWFRHFLLYDFLIFEELNLASLEKYMFEWFGLSSFILFYRFYWFMVILFGYSNSVLDIAKLFIHCTFSKTSFNLSLTIF